VFDDRDVEQWVALALGVEAPITITRHLQLVPQFRIHQVANAELGQLFPSGKSVVRPRVARAVAVLKGATTMDKAFKAVRATTFMPHLSDAYAYGGDRARGRDRGRDDRRSHGPWS
jgi:hypothetical protein